MQALTQVHSLARSALWLAAAAGTFTAAPAQSTLLDINQNPGPPGGDSSPEALVTIGSEVWFSAEDPTHGRELWRSDGVPGGSGTLRVTDIRSGAGGSNPEHMTRFGDAIYFAATDGIHGQELWRLPLAGPGISAQRITDIAPLFRSSNPRELTVVGSTLFFVASNTVFGAQLYAVDSANPGSFRRVTDGQFGTGTEGPKELARFGNRLLFSGFDTAAGREPWISDGTTAGTVRLLDIRPRAFSSSPTDFVVSGNQAFFVALGNVNGREIWTTDGTANGTTLFLDVLPGVASSHPSELTIAGNLFTSRLVFAATTPTDGRELFVTRTGTASATALNLRPGSQSSNPTQLSRFGSRLAFTSEDAQGDALLHVYDPIFGGLSTIRFDQLGGLPPSIDEIEVSGQLLYCRVGVGAVFSSDGTQAGSQFVTIGQIGEELADLPGGRAVFSRGDIEFGIEPVVSSGGMSELLIDANPGLGTRDSDPTQFTALPPDVLDGSAVICTADDGIHGTELVTLVGSTGAHTVIDVRTGPAGSEPSRLIRVGDEVWFLADDGIHGRELWCSRGDVASTSLLLDLVPGQADPGIQFLHAFGDRACFVTNDGVNDVGFWITDGTPGGTRRLTTVFTGAQQLLTVEALEIDGELLAIASSGFVNPLPPVTVIQTGGTPATTSLHRLNNRGSASSLGEVGGKLVFNQSVITFNGASNIFSSFDPRTGAVSVLHTSTISANVRGRATGGRYFFLGEHPSLGGEPFLTLGTPASTRAFVDVVRGAGSSIPLLPGLSLFDAETAAADGVWFCQLDDGVNGVELWRSDGTSSQTWRVSQLGAGSTSGLLSALTPVGSGRDLLFAGNGELWTASDRRDSARLLQEIRPGSDGSHPKHFTTSGGWVYFSADDGFHGREAWALPLTAIGAPNQQFFGKSCSQGSRSLLSTLGQPRIGATDFSVVIGPTQPDTPVALRFGLAASRSPLPGGCTLRTPEIASFGVLAGPRGFTQITIPVPNDLQLLGGLLYTQAAFGEVRGPLFGSLGLSEGLQIVIGR